MLSHLLIYMSLLPRLQCCLLCSAKEFPVLIRHLPFVNFNSFPVSTRYGEDLQHIRGAFITQRRQCRTSVSRTLLWSSTTFGLGAVPLALFVLRSLEPQHFDDYVGVLVKIVLSASGLVAEDASVAVSVVVLWSVVAVAVLWHVVAVVPSITSVLLSVFGGSDLAVWVRSICFSRVRVFCTNPHHFWHFLRKKRCHPNLFLRTFDRFCSVCATHRLLPSTPVTLAGPVKWPFD